MHPTETVTTRAVFIVIQLVIEPRPGPRIVPENAALAECDPSCAAGQSGTVQSARVDHLKRFDLLDEHDFAGTCTGVAARERSVDPRAIIAHAVDQHPCQVHDLADPQAL